MTNGPIRRPRHPANVPGPFYVEEGCCTACAIWEPEAPNLIGWIEEEDQYGKGFHCYIARQPETDAEFEQMIQVMEVAELDCFRVQACRPDWEARLMAAGFGDNIDPPEGPAT